MHTSPPNFPDPAPPPVPDSSHPTPLKQPRSVHSRFWSWISFELDFFLELSWQLACFVRYWTPLAPPPLNHWWIVWYFFRSTVSEPIRESCHRLYKQSFLKNSKEYSHIEPCRLDENGKRQAGGRRFLLPSLLNVAVNNGRVQSVYLTPYLSVNPERFGARIL